MNEFIGLREAKQLVGSELSDRLHIYLKNGLIHGRAKIANVWSTQASAKETFKDWEVPQNVWEAPRGYCRLELNEDRFTGRTAYSYFWDVELVGLSFDKIEFLDAFDIQLVDKTNVTAMPSKSKGGRKCSAKWPDFVAAISVWLATRNDEIDEILLLGPDVILSAISQIGAEWGVEFARGTFQPAIKKMLERLEEESTK